MHITGGPASRPDGGPALQAIRQAEIAGPLVKRVFEIDSVEMVSAVLSEAVELATASEPGPVVVQIEESTLRARAPGRGSSAATAAPAAAAEPDVVAIADRLASARHPLLLCGQGALGAAELVRALAERLRVPVLTTTSGRGVVPENHPWSLPFDSPGASAATLNQLIESSDLVLALGAKFSHNGSLGFALRLPSERLIRVDASAEVLAQRYPASLAVEADVPALLSSLSDRLAETGTSDWDGESVEGWRRRLAAAATAVAEPQLAGHSAEEVFAALRRALPETAVVTTDSGLHQYLVRRHLRVLAPRTLLVPANFQSMGFGLPAAIGAAVATGGTAVAVVGDGGFAIGGLELATAVQAGLRLVVVVLVDRSFGLIRLQQLRRTGRTSGVELPALRLDLIAAATGAAHVRVEKGTLDSVFSDVVESDAVTLVELPVGPDDGLGRARVQGRVVGAADALFGPDAVRRAAGVVRRRGS